MRDQTCRSRAFSLIASVGLIVGVASSADAITFLEIGDAGDLPGIAQAAGTLPLLTQITGSIANGTDADLFAISLATAGQFSATTAGVGTLGDTQLFLFNASGVGILANDDTIGLRAALPGTSLDAGLYFLAISSFNRDPVSAGGLIFPSSPFSGVFGPTGPGGAGPITGWLGSGGTGTYTIDLQLEPVPEPATLVLFGTALAGIGIARRKLRKHG